MERFSSTTRLTLGLTCLSVTILLGAQLLGLIPSRQQAVLEKWAALGEALAAQCTALASREDMPAMESILDAIVARDPQVAYARVRRADGATLFEARARPGPNGAVSHTRDGEVRLAFPIITDARRWGDLEITFAAPSSAGFWQLAGDSQVRFIVFVVLATLSAYFLYLRRLLQHLLPSRVVPERVRTTLDTFAEGLLVLDDRERIVMANQSFAMTMGRSPESLQGHSVSALPWRHTEHSKPAQLFPWQQAMREKRPQIGKMIDLQPDGARPRRLMVNASPILGDEGESQGVFVSFDDVTVMEQNRAELTKTLAMLKQSRDEIHSKNLELQRLAARDPLTGCLNRRSFFKQLESRWSDACRHSYELAYVMVDIDHFKAVNDQHGHGVGDEVLRKVAEVLLATARQEDVVCRYGGEEFAVLLPHLGADGAAKVAERYRQQIASARCKDLSVTASFGVSATGDGAASVRELVEQADKALYVAKRRGRDQVCCWHTISDDERVVRHEGLQQNTRQETPPAPTIPFQAVTALISALAYRDTVTAEHSRRVADLCVAVAADRMPIGEAYLLEIAALLHDIGKIGVPDSILLKPGPLSDEEWKVMRAHEHIGAAIVDSAFACKPLTEIVENYRIPFGGGAKSSRRPTGNQLPLGARILAIADAFDSMISDRTYRSGRSEKEAFGELRRCAGTQFDPELVEALIEYVTARDTTRLGPPPRVSKQTALRIGLQIENLACALDNEDRAGVAAEASRLKKTATRCGVPDIARLAERLERLAADPTAPMQLAELTRDLLDLCRSTRSALFDPSARLDPQAAADIRSEMPSTINTAS